MKYQQDLNGSRSTDYHGGEMWLTNCDIARKRPYLKALRAVGIRAYASTHAYDSKGRPLGRGHIAILLSRGQGAGVRKRASNATYDAMKEVLKKVDVALGRQSISRVMGKEILEEMEGKLYWFRTLGDLLMARRIGMARMRHTQYKPAGGGRY